MTALIGVHHYHLRHHRSHPGSDAPSAPVTTNPATIAASAIDAAKGGHIVAVHLPDAGTVFVHPEDDLGTVTAQMSEALSPPGDTVTALPVGKRGGRKPTDTPADTDNEV